MSNASESLGDVANRLLFENEHVRVWEMDLAPGERSDRHRQDLPYLLCVLEGTRIDADIEGRGVVEIPVQPGSVFRRYGDRDQRERSPKRGRTAGDARDGEPSDEGGPSPHSQRGEAALSLFPPARFARPGCARRSDRPVG